MLLKPFLIYLFHIYISRIYRFIKIIFFNKKLLKGLLALNRLISKIKLVYLKFRFKIKTKFNKLSFDIPYL